MCKVVCAYLCVAIIAQSQRIGSGQTQQVFASYAGMSGGQLDCRNRCLWSISPFDCGYKVENFRDCAVIAMQKKIGADTRDLLGACTKQIIDFRQLRHRY